MTGNQSGAVLLDYVLKRRKESGTLPENGVMISTIVTSDLGDSIAASYGVRKEKTLTGFKFIGDKIHKHETSDGAQFMFGYEESYGCLIGDFVRDKDGVQASVMLCEAAAYYRKQGKTLIDVLDEIYEKYGYTLDYLESITLKGIDGAEKIKEIMKQLRENPPKVIDGFEVVKIEDYSKGGFGDMPKADVLKIYFEGGSWVAVRPSGTEPKCKFYYGITAKDKESAKEVLESMKNYFHKVTQ